MSEQAAESLLAARFDEAVSALEDIASGDWQRYPERSMHGKTTVEDYAMWVLQEIEEWEVDGD